MVEQRDLILHSTITVVENQTDDVNVSYTILDGNHRFAAMTEVHKNNPNKFVYVPCKVYTNLDTPHRYLIALQENEITKHFDKVPEINQLIAMRIILYNHKLPLQHAYNYLKVSGVR